MAFIGASPPLALAGTGFDLTLVRPSPSGAAYVQQESVALLPAGTWAWSAVANGSWDPLILREPATNQHQGGLIERRMETTLSAAWAPLDNLTLAISLAGVAWQSGSGGDVPLATAAASPRHQALGDASLFLKVGLLGVADRPGFRLTFSGELFAPTGQASSYAGSGGWTALARLWGGYLSNRGSVTLGLGYDVVPRADVPLAGILIDDRWTASAAGALRLTNLVTLLAEAQASVLFETARRVYPRGFMAALRQAPAYALAGARVDLSPRGHLLLAIWSGLDANPGAAKLGLLAGWNATWDGPFAHTARATTTMNESAREGAQTGTEQTGPQADQQTSSEKSADQRNQNGSEKAAETNEALAEGPGGPAPEEGNDKGASSKTHEDATSPCPAGDCAPSEADGDLVRLEDGRLVLAGPLPFKGRSAKLAAASIPVLKAIAKVMKEQPAGTRLTLHLESVGARPADLALAKKRAQALRGVFAHLAHWPAKRISALGMPSSNPSGTRADVSKPPITLELAGRQGHSRSEEIKPAPAEAAEVAAAPAPAPTEGKEPTTAPAPSPAPATETATDDALIRREGDQLVLAKPLPFQGRTAKLAAASIPVLKAIAKAMRDAPAGTRLTLRLEAVGSRPVDLALAKKRAQALRGVFAHLAHWPAKRISALGVPATGTATDPSEPSLSLELASKPGPQGSHDAGGTDDTEDKPEASEDQPAVEATPCPSGDCEPNDRAGSAHQPGSADAAQLPPGELAAQQGDQIALAQPLPFKGKSAKLAASSIPALKAVAQILKNQPAGTHLSLSLEAVGAKPADMALATKRARALRGVFAHLAHWPAQRISAVGVAPTTTATDAATSPATDSSLPPLSLRLGSPEGHGKATRSTRKR